MVWILWALTALGSGAGLMVHWMPVEVVVAMAILAGLLTVFGIFLGTLPAYQNSGGPALFRAAWARRRIPSLRAGVSVIVDTLTAGVALLAAFLARYESALPEIQLHNLKVSLPVFMASHGLLSLLERSYRLSWRQFSLRDVLFLGRISVLSAALSMLCLWIFRIDSYPRSVVFLYCLICLCASAALRSSFRMLQEIFLVPGAQQKRVAIFGADPQGEVLLNILRNHSELEAAPVLFVDQDESKQGLRILGIPVRHCNANLPELSAQFGLEAVVVPGGSLEPGASRHLEQECRNAGVDLLALDISIRQLTPQVEVSLPEPD